MHNRTPPITRKFEFDAGHRVLNHESKCANLHGHRYVAEVTVDAPTLDGIGRVIDFSCLKEIVGDWIDENWDHNILLHADDPLLRAMQALRRQASPPAVSDTWDSVVFNRKPPFIMPYSMNPTAENMATLLYGETVSLLHADARSSELSVVRVRLYETPNCWAEVERGTSRL